MVKNSVKKVAKNYINFLKKDGLIIERALLFGSHVKGNARKDSDIDVCIVSPKFKNNFEALQYLWQKRRDIDVSYGIEPVGYNPKDFAEDENPFVWEIKKTGIRVL